MGRFGPDIAYLWKKNCHCGQRPSQQTSLWVSGPSDFDNHSIIFQAKCQKYCPGSSFNLEGFAAFFWIFGVLTADEDIWTFFFYN